MIESTLTPRRAALAKAGFQTLTTHTFGSELGWVSIVGHGETLCWLTFGHPTQHEVEATLRSQMFEDAREERWHDKLAEAIADYAAGYVVDFEWVKLELSHLGEFQREVVRLCRRIPRGETLSYGQLARLAGSPRAARAVGNVMRMNRYPLIVPCHRVVAANGGLGGYSAPDGLDMKQRLLEMERGAATV